MRQKTRLDISHKALYKNETNNIEFSFLHKKRYSFITIGQMNLR